MGHNPLPARAALDIEGGQSRCPTKQESDNLLACPDSPASKATELGAEEAKQLSDRLAEEAICSRTLTILSSLTCFACIMIPALLIWHIATYDPNANCVGPLLGPLPRAPPGDVDWARFHKQLVDEVALADRGKGLDLVFYGDSITEDWRGTAGGTPWRTGRGSDKVFYDYFSSVYPSEVLAIAGDQVGHLWWRVLNGELPVLQPPGVAVIMIGTNDLTMADCWRNAAVLEGFVPGIADRIKEVIKVIHSSSNRTQVILQAVLPRSAEYWGMNNATTWAKATNVTHGLDYIVDAQLPELFQWPNRLSKALRLLNIHLKAVADTMDGVTYLDCGEPFIGKTLDQSFIDPDLMPDGLHPNRFGMELIAKCLRPLVDSFLQPSTTAPSRPHP